MHVDVGTHANQLGHMHEAVLEDRLGDHRGALGDAHQRHHLGLHVGGKAGVGLGHHIDPDQPVAAADPQSVRGLGDLDARLVQRLGHRIDDVQLDPGQLHLAAGRGRRHGEGAGLDTVGHHAMFRRVQRVNALNDQRVGADALDLRAHGDQAFRQVRDLGLARGVDQFALAPGETCRHHQVFRRAHRHEREHVMPALQALGRFCMDIAVGELDLGAQGLQPLQMQIDRPRADGAAAGQRHPGLATARHQRPQHQDAGPHLAHQIVGRGGAGDLPGGHLQYMAGAGIAHADLHPMLHQQLHQRGDIGQERQVGERQCLVGQQARRYQGERRVLRAADADRAL